MFVTEVGKMGSFKLEHHDQKVTHTYEQIVYDIIYICMLGIPWFGNSPVTLL